MTTPHYDWMSDDLRTLSRQGPVHFMGICGAGMSALAELLVRSGGMVSGCDLRPGITGHALRALGVTVDGGHAAAHVDEAVALIITSAIPHRHPEIQAARERGIPVLKRAQALGAIVNTGTVLAVAGTHGKTTTTAAATAILEAADLDPTGLVGGRMLGWGGGLRAGHSDIFVVEADEYDRSFLELRPEAAVVTNVEADHLDIYGDLSGVEGAFTEFLSKVQPGGLIAVCGDDAGARRIGAAAAGTGMVLTYGTGEDAQLRATDVSQQGGIMRFTVVDRGATLGAITLGAPGVHNVRNALGAFALARHAGATLDAARTALATFSGVSRRFQVLGTASGISVIDDYAHHPTEIVATIEAARGAYPDRRVVAAFQPHLYSRTRDLANEFGRALALADRVWITDVFAAREEPFPGVDGGLVVRAAMAAGADSVTYAPTLEELSRGLLRELADGDVLVAMGAGDISDMTQGLFAVLDAGAHA
ncbi:MAG: UDP-N-acetylmuramate--L-alanine ligase [Gemmatimonadota bacterium]